MQEIAARVSAKRLSFNNFVTVKDKSGKPYIIVIISSANWEKKIFKLLELVNECLKFPLLFTIDITSTLRLLNLSKTSVRELLHIFFQFACNAYLHRFRIYTEDEGMKKTIDGILDSSIYKYQKKISKTTPHKVSSVYNAWRRSRGSPGGPEVFNPTRPEINMASDTAKAAMYEQLEIWRAKEGYLLKKFDFIYREYDIRNQSQPSPKVQDVISRMKEKYAIIDLKSGDFVLAQDHEKSYQFGYDGAHFFPLKRDETGKFTAASNTNPANEIVLVSKDTQLMNELSLYERAKKIDIPACLEIKLNLVQGVPGCGKTTFILNNCVVGDLVLFPTRDAAKDFKTRYQKLHPELEVSFIDDHCRTLHSFIINSTKHMKSGSKYQRLIVDEALMLHAGEILFAAALSGVREVMLIGDVNQIPYINRTESFEVKYHNIAKIAQITRVLNLSYRCTKSTASILSEFYPQGMQTTSQVQGELRQEVFAGLENIKLDMHKYEVLVFKQSEKLKMQTLGYKTSTVHEYQGRQADHVAVVRLSAGDEEIYNSKPHCLVAISRHRKSFLYISPTVNDTLSNWIHKSTANSSPVTAEVPAGLTIQESTKPLQTNPHATEELTDSKSASPKNQKSSNFLAAGLKRLSRLKPPTEIKTISSLVSPK